MYIVCDIGGTKMRVARSSDYRTFDEDPIIKSTPKKFAEGVEQLIEMISTCTQGRTVIAGIAIGIAGVFNTDHTELVRSPNLSDWQNQPLVAKLKQAFSCNVYLENDTDMVGLGEMTFGAGKGAVVAGYVTISTGVGGTRFTEGRIDRSAYGFEPGHQIIDFHSGLTAENTISGTATMRRLHLDHILDAPPETWYELAQPAAVTLYNAGLMWSPEVIVVGGSMIVKKIVINWEEILEEYAKLPDIFPTKPELRKATLDDFGGLYGGIAYLNQKFNQ